MAAGNILGAYLNKAIHRNPPELTEYENLDGNNATRYKHKPIVVTTTSFEGCLPETSKKKIDFTRIFPDELVLEILSFLGPEGLGKCAQVSRRFNAYSCDNILWRAFVPGIQIPEELKEETSSIKDYIFKVGLYSVEELGKYLAQIQINKYINVDLTFRYLANEDPAIFDTPLAKRVNFTKDLSHFPSWEVHVDFLQNPRCHYFSRAQTGDNTTETINYIFIKKIRNVHHKVQRVEFQNTLPQRSTENKQPKGNYHSFCLPISEDEEKFEFEVQLQQAIKKFMEQATAELRGEDAN